MKEKTDTSKFFEKALTIKEVSDDRWCFSSIFSAANFWTEGTCFLLRPVDPSSFLFSPISWMFTSSLLSCLPRTCSVSRVSISCLLKFTLDFVFLWALLRSTCGLFNSVPRSSSPSLFSLLFDLTLLSLADLLAGFPDMEVEVLPFILGMSLSLRVRFCTTINKVWPTVDSSFDLFHAKFFPWAC